MKRKKVYAHSENRAEQLVKTATQKHGTYTYRFFGKETVVTDDTIIKWAFNANFERICPATYRILVYITEI